MTVGSQAVRSVASASPGFGNNHTPWLDTTTRSGPPTPSMSPTTRSVGAPSVNAVWGNKVSILVGDLFYSRVLFRLADIDDPKITNIVSTAIKRICEGELIQLQNGVDYGAIEERTYFDLIDKKTASLIAVSCELGALASSSPAGAGARAALRSFGTNIGIAFQIKDDVMDIVGNPDSLGKPASHDLLESTLTLPLIHGLRHSNNGGRGTVLAAVKRGVTEDDIETIHRFVRETGGLEYAERVAREYRDRALACLAGFDDSIHKRSLIELADFIIDRSY